MLYSNQILALREALELMRQLYRQSNKDSKIRLKIIKKYHFIKTISISATQPKKTNLEISFMASFTI